MQLILIRDVKGMGRAHQEVTVSDGYALNYLIPKKYAIAATPTARAQAQLRQKEAVDRSAIDAALLTANIAALAEANIVIKMKANEKGHLYDAVGAGEIVRAAKDAHIDLSEDVIKLEKPIKEIGTFDVPVAAGETFGKFSITVAAE